MANTNYHFFESAYYNLSGENSEIKFNLDLKFGGLDYALVTANDKLLEYNLDYVLVTNAKTGECICEVRDEDKEEKDDIYDPFDEMGFNPYLGDYDYDC